MIFSSWLNCFRFPLNRLSHSCIQRKIDFHQFSPWTKFYLVPENEFTFTESFAKKGYFSHSMTWEKWEMLQPAYESYFVSQQEAFVFPYLPRHFALLKLDLDVVQNLWNIFDIKQMQLFYFILSGCLNFTSFRKEQRSRMLSWQQLSLTADPYEPEVM